MNISAFRVIHYMLHFLAKFVPSLSKPLSCFPVGWSTPAATLLPRSRGKPVQLGMRICLTRLLMPKLCWRKKETSLRPTACWSGLSRTLHVNSETTWCQSMTLSSCNHQSLIIPSSPSTRMTGFAASPTSYILMLFSDFVLSFYFPFAYFWFIIFL